MRIPNTNNYIDKRIGATVIDYTLIFALYFFYVYQVGAPNEEGGYTVTGTLAHFLILFCF